MEWPGCPLEQIYRLLPSCGGSLIINSKERIMFSRTHFIISLSSSSPLAISSTSTPGSGIFSLEDQYLTISPALIAFEPSSSEPFSSSWSPSSWMPQGLRALAFLKSERKEGKIRERYSDALEEMLKGNIQEPKRPSQDPGPAADPSAHPYIPGQPLFPRGKVCRGARGPLQSQSPRTRQPGAALRPGEEQRGTEEVS